MGKFTVLFGYFLVFHEYATQVYSFITFILNLNVYHGSQQKIQVEENYDKS